MTATMAVLILHRNAPQLQNPFKLGDKRELTTLKRMIALLVQPLNALKHPKKPPKPRSRPCFANRLPTAAKRQLPMARVPHSPITGAQQIFEAEADVPIAVGDGKAKVRAPVRV